MTDIPGSAPDKQRICVYYAIQNAKYA